MMSIIDFCSICFPKKKSIKKGEKKHNGPKPRFSTSQIDLQASGHVQLGVLYMLNRRYFSELRPGWGDRRQTGLTQFCVVTSRFTLANLPKGLELDGLYLFP